IEQNNAVDDPKLIENCVELFFIRNPIHPERTTEYFTQGDAYAQFHLFTKRFPQFFLAMEKPNLPFTTQEEEIIGSGLLVMEEDFLSKTLNNIIFDWPLSTIKRFFKQDMKKPSQEQSAEGTSATSKPSQECLFPLKPLLHALAQNDRGPTLNFILITCHADP